MGPAQGLWWHFTSALQDAASWSDASRGMPSGDDFVVGPERAMLELGIKRGQRFSLDSKAAPFHGKSFADLEDLLHLPFDIVAILSETYIKDDDGIPDELRQRMHVGTVLPSITVAVDLESQEARDRLAWAVNGERVVERAVSTVSEQLAASGIDAIPWCLLGSYFKLPGIGWLPSYGLSLVGKFRDGGDLFLAPFPYPLSELGRTLLARPETARDLDHDLNVVASLCVTLGLHNVSAERVPVPPKLAASRSRKGQAPLYDYHVLTVEWYGEGGHDPGDGTRTIRSHLRRGHVRRLPDGRRIWVRAAMVHGRRDGFLAKDYAVGG